MGKKYIVEIGRLERLYKAFIGAHGKPEITWLSPEVDLTPYTVSGFEQVRKEAYEKGLSDAWDAARKIVLPGDVSGIYLADLEEIFDRSSLQDVIKDYSASECIEKIRQYEQEKEEIKVGDEVINRDKKAVVTEITDRFVRIMYSDGSGYALFSENMTKTGRTFPEISEVLQKMKETDNG